MVKKKVGGSHRYKALQQASKGAEQEQEQAGPKPPQHLQRKITKKVKFFEKVAQSSTAAALQVERGVKKKRASKAKQLPNLQSLAGELEQLVQQQHGQQEQQRPGKGIRSSIKRSKARLAITISETQRLQQVLQHPTYQADPILAITNHLTATMPARPQPPKQQKQQPGSKKKKQKKGGCVADMQS